jgi:hypothetical protein
MPFPRASWEQAHFEFEGQHVQAFVAAKVQDFEGAEVLFGGFLFALYANQALAGGVDGEFAEVGGDPLAAKFFRRGGRGAGATEEVGDKVPFFTACPDYAFEEGLGLLGCIVGGTVAWILVIPYALNRLPSS